MEKGIVICQTDEMCRTPGHLPCDTTEGTQQIFSGGRTVFKTAEEGEIYYQPWPPSSHAPSQERDDFGNQIQYITIQKPILGGISHCLAKCPVGLSLVTTGKR